MIVGKVADACPSSVVLNLSIMTFFTSAFRHQLWKQKSKAIWVRLERLLLLSWKYRRSWINRRNTWQIERHYQHHGESFPQITLTDALHLPEMDSRTWKHVVPSDHSKGRIITRLGELRFIKHFGGGVWLTEMDHLSVPFYQAYTDNTCTKARCADLLLGNGEVLGLGQRHILANDILAALEQHEVPAKPYD
jgi:aspartyl/asparaginyl-tRNA synthetase